MIEKLIKAGFVIIALAAVGSVMAQSPGHKSRTPLARSFKEAGATQHPLYAAYKGVRIGMTATEARATLGEPALKSDEQDYYTFGENEAAQIGYDAQHKVTVISVDYMGGVGAPDPKTVVGGELETKAGGSTYKLVRYESLGFWVSYNRTAGPVVIVTVTIQKLVM